MARGSHASQPAWSYVAANASQPVLEQTLGDALRLAVKTWPSKPALIQGALETSERRKWTFQGSVANLRLRQPRCMIGDNGYGRAACDD